MRSAKGDTSNRKSLGSLTPLGFASTPEGALASVVVLAWFARSAWLVCAERATEKNRSIGTESSGPPNSPRCPGKYRVAAHAPLCQI